MPFEDSRRLTGPNLFFACTGAVLEVASGIADDSLLDAWRTRVSKAQARLGWISAHTVVRVHRPSGTGGAAQPLRPSGAAQSSTLPGVTLALTAPRDQLFVATEINEWALCSALLEQDPIRWSGLEEALMQAALENADDPNSVIPPVLGESTAVARFERLAAVEARPDLQALIDAAMARELPYVLDDTSLTVGAGTGAADFPLTALPSPEEVRWESLHGVPTAIVTGSNGKTTTVRLLAACARAHGWHVAYCSTDGVFFDGQIVDAGDYSGPAGARMAVRDRRAQAAILETARGGILRRGLAVSQAQLALVTNISPDHFGEYGIYDLEALADVKLTVGAVVVPGGLLVLNADDPVLRERLSGLAVRSGRAPRVGWFALDADSGPLREHRAQGGSTCGVRDGHLSVSHQGTTHDLGAISSMPLTVDGAAIYNIANLAGAALGAVAMDIPASVVASVCATFGANPLDNLGRMMRFDVGGVHVILDYAHNAEGLRGLLNVAERLREGNAARSLADGAARSLADGAARSPTDGVGRLGLLLGHAGNRRDVEIEELARVAAEFHPDLVVVKENESHLRGREHGEVPRIIHAALLRAGLPPAAVPVRMTELEAARCALEWARPGDVVALLVHSSAARSAVLALLEALKSGQPLSSSR